MSNTVLGQATESHENPLERFHAVNSPSAQISNLGCLRKPVAVYLKFIYKNLLHLIPCFDSKSPVCEKDQVLLEGIELTARLVKAEYVVILFIALPISSQ